MDVNGTRFHMLLGKPDFERCTDDRDRPLGDVWRAGRGAPAVDWDGGRSELTLHEPELFTFPAGRGDQPPVLEARRGGARDRFGNWYWIGPHADEVRVGSGDSDLSDVFWTTGTGERRPERVLPGAFGPTTEAPRDPRRLAGLAVTDDHYLVAGAVDPGGLVVWDLQSGGAPTVVTWPAGVPFEPWDLAARPGGGVAILDRANGLAWELDRLLRVIPAGRTDPPPGPDPDFAPASGEPAACARPDRPLTIADATDVALGAGDDAISIEVAGDGSLLILLRGTTVSTLRRFLDGVPAGQADVADPSLDLTVVAHDMALARAEANGARVGTLYVADRAGNQAYAFDLALGVTGLELEAQHAYHPMRRFGGMGIVVAGGQPYYDFGERWIPLVAQRRPRYETDGAFRTEVLDSDEPGCVWHRLFIDVCMPAGASIAVQSAAADEEAALLLSGWSDEPAPRERPGGCELPFAPATGGYRTFELLFQRAHGRYLRLRLTLSGDGRTTPRVRALRIHYPRFSYLERYLPAAYREDHESASFLDRFLANFEGIDTAIEDRIAGAQVLFDPRTVPAESLDWLGTWFEVALDPSWNEAKRRLFLLKAMDFFRLRGTTRGIEAALRLVLEPAPDPDVFSVDAPSGPRDPRVVESFRARQTPGVVFGDPTDPEPRVVEPAVRWKPEDGAELLGHRYGDALDAAGLPRSDDYPVDEPSGDEGRVWRDFSLGALGVVPQRPADGDDAWVRFLTRRYPNVGALNAAHGTAVAEIADAELPAELTERKAVLTDWYQFQAVVLPMRRRAHRFTVLLPARRLARDASDRVIDRDELRELARRVVNAQKPAQTRFEVRFFWAALRVGEARLGYDTIVESGSRAPELLPESILGLAHAGESQLGGEPARDTVRRPAQRPSSRQRTNPTIEVRP